MNYVKKTFPYISGLLCMLCACTKDFQEINTTPGKPVTTTIPPLVNGVISTLFLKGQEQVSVHNDWYYPATQLAAVSASSGYLLDNGALDIWNDYYSTLQNLNLIQDKINAAAADSGAEMLNNVQAIAYTLRAYKTFRVIDQFGDIPYFRAGRAYTKDPGYFRPAYDSQESIYDTLLTQLQWAVKNINTATNPVTSDGKAYVSLGTSETFFNNNMTLWKKFANSLLLRYAMQIVEKAPDKATPILQSVLTGGNPFIEENEDVGMWPANLGGYILNDSRFWAFTSHRFVRISTAFWNLVADGTTDAGIFDPRVYLFAETNQAGKWAPYKVGSGAIDNANPYKGDRDNNIADKDGCLYSPFNYHLVRDIYYQPELFMTAAEVHFLKAEAYARGLGVAKNMATAETEYRAGITSSVNFWYKIAHNTNVTNDDWAAVAPPNPTEAQMNALLTNPKVAFTANETDNLNKIYAQEWLSFFREPWLAFNLWRRTGRTPRDGNPGAYAAFYRLTYPQIEGVNNTDNYNAQVSRMGGNTSSVKVWWMK